jgi:hypothetical protein
MRKQLNEYQREFEEILKAESVQRGIIVTQSTELGNYQKLLRMVHWKKRNKK